MGGGGSTAKRQADAKTTHKTSILTMPKPTESRHLRTQTLAASKPTRHMDVHHMT